MAPRGGRSTRSTAARRATATAAKPSQRQSSLTFSNSRVTKPSTIATSAKDQKAEAEAEAEANAETKATILVQEQDEKPAVTEVVEDVIVDDEHEQEQEEKAKAKPIPIRTQLQAKPAVTKKEEQEEAGSPEANARKISEAQIRRYWKAKEAERKTPRVHQKELSLYEKVLREFDMSNQYGPCIGITRMRRWNRARGLGLEPPVEVLAVLLKGLNGESGGMAHMDGLINSRLGIVAQ